MKIKENEIKVKTIIDAVYIVYRNTFFIYNIQSNINWNTFGIFISNSIKINFLFFFINCGWKIKLIKKTIHSFSFLNSFPIFSFLLIFNYLNNEIK